MTTEQVQAIGPALTAFLQPFERFFDTLKTIRHFRNYARGLLSDLPRKTAEPLAQHAGVPPRNLQQFLKACLWNHEGLVNGKEKGTLLVFRSKNLRGRISIRHSVLESSKERRSISRRPPAASRCGRRTSHISAARFLSAIAQIPLSLRRPRNTYTECRGNTRTVARRPMSRTRAAGGELVHQSIHCGRSLRDRRLPVKNGSFSRLRRSVRSRSDRPQWSPPIRAQPRSESGGAT